MRDREKAILEWAAAVALIIFVIAVGIWFVSTEVGPQTRPGPGGCYRLTGILPSNPVPSGDYKVTVFGNGTSLWCLSPRAGAPP